MQDKNGTDIYEGDIVKILGNENGYFEVVFQNAYVGGWVLKYPKCGSVISLGARNPSEIEIIGNIFEHPELLETEVD